MKKNALYYEDRLFKKGREKIDAITSGLSSEEVAKIPDEILESHYPDLMLHRINVCLREAEALVLALVNDTPDLNGKYDLSWQERVSLLEGGTLVTETYTKEEIIARLEWIANEDFGDDLDEWQSWLSAFKANPPVGSR